MRVVGSIKQVLVIQLAEDRGHLYVAISHRVLRMCLEYLLEVLDRAVVVQDVEARIALANQSIEVQWVGMLRESEGSARLSRNRSFTVGKRRGQSAYNCC